MISSYIRTAGVYLALVPLRLLAVFFFPARALAKSTTTGATSGPIIEPSHAAIPNAAVTFRSIATGAARIAATGANGIHHFAFLQPCNNTVSMVTPMPEIEEAASMAMPNNFQSSTNFLYQEGGMVR